MYIYIPSLGIIIPWFQPSNTPKFCSVSTGLPLRALWIWKAGLLGQVPTFQDGCPNDDGDTMMRWHNVGITISCQKSYENSWIGSPSPSGGWSLDVPQSVALPNRVSATHHRSRADHANLQRQKVIKLVSKNNLDTCENWNWGMTITAKKLGCLDYLRPSHSDLVIQT